MAAAHTVLTLRNDLDEIARLSNALEQFAAQHDVSSATLNAVNVALEEIVTNVISYAYDGGDHAIGVEFWLDDGSVHAVVTDDGRAYDPLQRPDPDVHAPLEERPIGGLGVMLVRRLMDEATYERRGGTNVLTVRKRL
jgi:anti-sigma regulatory factor (Ser/Thr protein kinase)